MKTVALFTTACVLPVLYGARQDSSSKALDAFNQRIGEYVKIHKASKGEAGGGLKNTSSPGEIQANQRSLAEAIRKARPDARQGDIFSAEIAAEFRRLLAATLEGPGGARIRESLQRGEPARPPDIRVNAVYPPGFPLQSTPPSLLLNLPKLPPELEYRVAGHDLILRDREANLIVDFIPDAIR
jgi:hypothetical protein